MAKDFSYYFSQLRKKEDHRSKQAEKDIRKLYKELLTDAKHFVAEEYYNLAEDGKLTYEILRANARDVRFLEEVEQQLTGVSKEVAESIRKTAEDVYRLAYDGMIEATQKGVKGFSGLGGATDEMIKAAVNNPIATTALEKNYKDTVWNIKRQIATGLMAGDRYDTMAKRLSKALDIDYKKSVRIVRTETGRVREAGHLASAKNVNDALKDGTTDMRLTKTWVTMKDERVRSSHQSMNGVTVAMDEDFTLPDGTKTQAPKQSGVASQDINCRCFVKYSLEEVLQQHIKSFSNDDILMEHYRGFNTVKVTKDDILAMDMRELRNFAMEAGVDYDEVSSSSMSELQKILCKKYDEHAKEVIEKYSEFREVAIAKASNKSDVQELLFGMTPDEFEQMGKVQLTNNMGTWGFEFSEVGEVYNSDDYLETFKQIVERKKQSVEISMTLDEYYDTVGKIAKNQKGIDTALEYQYVQTSNSYKINKALYSGGTLDAQDKIVVEYLKEKAEPLKKDMTLYRAVGEDFLTSNNVKVGGIIENAGFSSTAIAPHEAFASEGVIFKINAPKGTKTFISTNIDEGEFILMPNQKMIVRSIEEADSVMCTVWNTDKACYNTKIVRQETLGRREKKMTIVEVDIV